MAPWPRSSATLTVLPGSATPDRTGCEVRVRWSPGTPVSLAVDSDAEGAPGPTESTVKRFTVAELDRPVTEDTSAVCNS